jgi:hypothetical protein
MTTNGDRPFFIVCCPRSGSTLLRLILDAHPRLAVPPPAWLIHYIYPYLYSYGDLSQRANLEAMIEDALETPTIQEWPVDLSVSNVREEMGSPNFAELYAALHRLYARATGKVRWGEKTPRDCFYMADIKALYPDAKFIHILRDGRDAAIDISYSILWPNGLYAAAITWRNFVRACVEEAAALGTDICMTVRYEDLCAEPRQTLEHVCDFLGESFDDSMLAHHQSESTRIWATEAVHAKTARPITTEFVAMYQTRLRPDDRAVIEGLIGDLLRETGYPVDESSKALTSREARKYLESDTISNTKAIAFKRWHEGRRKERRDRGVWHDSDKTTDLLGFY